MNKCQTELWYVVVYVHEKRQLADWVSIRTTNTIERVNKEFKRRTKPMEILAGEESAYRLLCFVALKMELGWKSCPIGKDMSPLIEANKFTKLNWHYPKGSLQKRIFYDLHTIRPPSRGAMTSK